MAKASLRICTWLCALCTASAVYPIEVSVFKCPYFVTLLFTQLVLGVILVSYGTFASIVDVKLLRKATRSQGQAESDVTTPLRQDVSHEDSQDPANEATSDALARGGSPTASKAVVGSNTVVDVAASFVDRHQVEGGLATALGERRRHLEWQQKWREAFEDNNGIFFSHTRSEDNFVRDSDDPAIRFPPASPMEIESPYYSRLVLYSFFWNFVTAKHICTAIGWGLLSGCIGTYLCRYHHVYDDSHEWIEEWRSDMTGFLSDVKWLPTFMLAGHITFYVQRWRQFMFAAWGAEGRLKDLGLVIGSDVSDPDDPYSRRVVFKIYRFMVLAMALQYKAYLPSLQGDVETLLRKLESMGLLMPEEVPVLESHGSTRMRDAVLSWIAVVVRTNGPAKTGVFRGTKTGVFRGNCEYAVLKQLTALRSKLMYFHGNNFYPQPNVFAAFMCLLVDIYCAAIIICYPFKMIVHISATHLYGFQPITIVSVVFMTSTLWGALEVTKRLAHPFSQREDTFNLDALIAGTEKTLFTSLRASFDSSRYLGQRPG